MKKYPYILLFFIILFFLQPVSSESNSILVVTIDGPITQATVELIKESLDHASALDAQAIVLQMNTPGGGLDETEKIIEIITSSDIPFIGYVYPKGGKAWSAGTYILMSCQIAAMSNYSVIGSCQPVEITPYGYNLVNDSKHINALKERIKSLAEMYHRNSSVAERFVTDNLNLEAKKALELGIIDVVADDINDLLKTIDGKNFSGIVLHTKNSTIVYHRSSIKYHIISILSDPTISSILLMLGIFSLIFGISSPGYGAEVFGVIAVILALFGMEFSIPYLSLILIIIGFIMLIIEIHVTPGFGVIGIGGIICIILASTLLVPSYPTRNWLVSIDYQTLLLVFGIVPSILVASFFLFALYKIVKVSRKKPKVGAMEGELAETLEEISPNKTGFVKYKGEYWLARSKEGKIPAREKVIIEKRDGNLLIVSIKKEGKD
ncbi:MAG TPA: nodulation protein NfeD [Thermoplasmatales archaeon]|nr:nodulation protein NfeD [Thermoplasmatales archaeon]